MESNTQKELESQRAVIFKSLKISKIATWAEGLIFFALGFVLTADLVLSLALAALLGAIFYRLFVYKIHKRKNIINAKILEFFLQKIDGKFKGGGFEKKLSEFELDFKEFQSNNCLEFKEFLLYDSSFKNAYNQSFFGVLLVLKKGKFGTNLNEEIFKGLDEAHFQTKLFLSIHNLAFIPNLSNPFLIQDRLSIDENLAKLQKNFSLLESFVQENLREI